MDALIIAWSGQEGKENMKTIQLVSFIALWLLLAGGMESMFDTIDVGAVAVFLAVCAVLAWSTWEVQR